MRPDFWLERWRLSQIGFHRPSVHPLLIEWWPQLKLAPTSRVLVPLCGKSLDMLWLLAQGHSVIGVELSETAVESFCMENGIPARRRALGGFSVFEARNLQLFCGDLFELSVALMPPVAAVYDRASLIAWAPELRQRYVDQMTALTAVGVQTLLITMEYAQAQMPGPPFAVSSEDIGQAYGRHHLIQAWDRQDILPTEPRLQAKGLDRLHEACYRLTRH